MRRTVTTLLAVAGLGVSGLATADTYASVYTCKVKDDVEMEAVHEANSKWLKFVNSKVAGGGITSSVGTAVVGNFETFIFVDTYPSLTSWAATQELLDSDAGDEIDGLFEDLTDCSKNSLWKFEATM
ncbi:MAG TPA: hypothetical protein VK854_13560 [Woeseiaceae bacterium]|nr:hypothetical protein [Woeseiaceae bacterium]